MRLKRVFTVAVLFAFSFCLFGCSEKKPLPKNTLRLTIRDDPRTLDPRTGGDAETSLLLEFLFDGLMQMGKSGAPECAIAKSYTLSEDLLTYTFHLRPAKWSNGAEVTAYDFEYAWKCMLDPEYVTEFCSMLDPIRGAKEAKSGKIPLDQVGIKVIDDKTLVVELAHPCPYFLEALTLAAYKPLCKEHVTKNPKWMNTTKEGFVCNGAFTIQDWKAGERLSYRKNPLYWDKDSITFEHIDISIIANDAAHLALFEAKQIDWVGYPMSTLPSCSLEEIRKRHSVKSLDLPLILMVSFNTKCPQLQSQTLRQALSMSIDRKAIAKDVVMGGAKPVFSMLPPQLSLSKTPLFQTDVSESKVLFQSAIKDTAAPTSFKLLVPSEKYEKVAQVMQQNWAKSLGVKTEIQQMEWKTFFDRLTNGDYEIAIIGWISGYSDPMYNLNIFADNTNLNFPSWVSSKYTQTIESSKYAKSTAERAKYLAEAERMLMEAMPIAPIVYYKGLYVSRDDLKGVVFSKRGDVIFKYAYFEDLQMPLGP